MHRAVICDLCRDFFLSCCVVLAIVLNNMLKNIVWTILWYIYPLIFKILSSFFLFSQQNYWSLFFFSAPITVYFPHKNLQLSNLLPSATADENSLRFISWALWNYTEDILCTLICYLVGILCEEESENKMTRRKLCILPNIHDIFIKKWVKFINT